MSQSITDIKRPSVAMIKAIEAIGILLRVPQSSQKSMFKAPVPSNYDATVALLQEDFYNVVNTLSAYESTAIPNDMASKLFSKTLEPGFDYEAAILSGGLICRELFNLLVLLIQKLQSDPYRIPVQTKNVLLIYDGSLASYKALDCLSHVILQLISQNSLIFSSLHPSTYGASVHIIIKQYLRLDFFHKTGTQSWHAHNSLCKRLL